MAYSQAKAIDILDDGSQIILEHWLKLQLIDGKILDQNQRGWLVSIDKWFDKFGRIKLKGSNKPPSLKQAIKWFFEEGSEATPSDIEREIKVLRREYTITKHIDVDSLSRDYREYIIDRFKNELGWL